MTKKEIRAEAIQILKGIDEVAKNEMLSFGEYVRNVTRPDLAAKGSICGGREACLIGSAYLAAGLDAGSLTLVDFDAQMGRTEFLADMPALRLAIQALDSVALPRVEKLVSAENQSEFFDDWAGSPAEGLFESEYSKWYELSTNKQRKKVMTLTKEARKALKEGVVS